jgi:spore germination cell wall hydrolase CwlJ-like protein
MIDQALACLATTIFMEASKEPLQAQIGVGYVLMRRADFNKKNVCLEMKKPYQFSWYGIIHPPPVLEQKYYDLAHKILNRKVYDYSYGATNFHDNSIDKPRSWYKMVKVVQWSHMIFYKQEETKYAQNI